MKNNCIFAKKYNVKINFIEPFASNDLEIGDDICI